MKKIAIVLSVVFLLISTGEAMATDNATASAAKNQIVTLGVNEIVNRDYFAAGQTVIVSGTVKGDAYVSGGQVIVDGVIEGDLLVAGGTVTLSGKIKQDVRMMGGNILISGEIGRNLTVMGGNIEIASTAILGGNLVGAGGNMIIASPIKGNVVAAVGQMTLTPKAKVAGDLTYFSDQEMLLSPGATVSGTLTHNLPKAEEITERLNRENLGKILPQRIGRAVERVTSTLFILGLLNSVVVGYLLVHFFPNMGYQAILSIEEHPWQTLGVGLLGLVAIPLLILLMMGLLIGLSLGAMVALWFGVTLYLGKIVFSYWLGARFIQGMQRMAGPGITVTVGIILYYMLSAVTYVGPVVTVLAMVFGTGAWLRTLKVSYLIGRVGKYY